MFTKQMSTTESDSIGKVGLMRNICQNDAQNRRNVQNLKENSGMIVVFVLSCLTLIVCAVKFRGIGGGGYWGKAPGKVKHNNRGISFCAFCNKLILKIYQIAKNYLISVLCEFFFW